MFTRNFLSSLASSTSCKFLRAIIVFTTLQSPAKIFASHSNTQNPYVETTELHPTRFCQLYEDYINTNNLKDLYGIYRGKTLDVVRFLEQFVNLEKLDCGYFPTQYYVRADEFTKSPPHLPHLKSITLDHDFSLQDLNWLRSYPLLENLTIYHYKKINVAPLQEMRNLLELNLLLGGTEAKVVLANRLPPSLRSLHVDDGYMDPFKINHLRLKKLSLTSKQITELPHPSSLIDLEYLDLSKSSICDLSAIKGNQSLKIFVYSNPSEEGAKADFSVLHTLTNLEELGLTEFSQQAEELGNAIKGLYKLQNLTLSGKQLFDLSCLEGANLHKLAIGGKLLRLVPISILQNPCLTAFDTTHLELADPVFSWDQLSPNIQHLRLGYSDFCDFSEISRFPLISLNCENVDFTDNEKQITGFASTLESLICKGSTLYSLLNQCREDILESFVKLKHLTINFHEENKPNSFEFLKKFPLLEEVVINSPNKIPLQAFNVLLDTKNIKKIYIMNPSYEVKLKMLELAKKGVPIES